MTPVWWLALGVIYGQWLLWTFLMMVWTSLWVVHRVQEASVEPVEGLMYRLSDWHANTMAGRGWLTHAATVLGWSAWWLGAEMHWPLRGYEQLCWCLWALWPQQAVVDAPCAWSTLGHRLVGLGYIVATVVVFQLQEFYYDQLVQCVLWVAMSVCYLRHSTLAVWLELLAATYLSAVYVREYVVHL